MSEVRAEAKESRRERRLERDKKTTTRFDEGVRKIYTLLEVKLC